MNKLAIPAILVATVMVAGIFAFMPVQQASTVHTTIIQNAKNLQSHVNLDGFIGESTADEQTKVVVLDTTDIGNVVEGHFVAVLPSADATCAAATDTDGINLLVGVAGGTLVDVLSGADQTTLVSGADVTYGGDTRGMCVYHGSFSTADTATITDVILQITKAGAVMPDNSYISVAVELSITETDG